MSLKEIFEEIYSNYRKQWVKNNKSSSKYFKDLEKNIKDSFKPYLKKYNLSIKPLGGQAIKPKNPYISLLASGHKTSKGIYPIYHFNFDKNEFYLGIGDADDNEPDKDLVIKFSEKSKTSTPMCRYFYLKKVTGLLSFSRRCRNRIGVNHCADVVSMGGDSVRKSLLSELL